MQPKYSCHPNHKRSNLPRSPLNSKSITTLYNGMSNSEVPTQEAYLLKYVTAPTT